MVGDNKVRQLGVMVTRVQILSRPLILASILWLLWLCSLMGRYHHCLFFFRGDNESS